MQNLSIGLNNNSKVSIERYVSMLKGQLNYVVEEGKFKYISYKIILIIKVIIFNKLSYSYRVLREVFKK